MVRLVRMHLDGGSGGGGVVVILWQGRCDGDGMVGVWWVDLELRVMMIVLVVII